MEKKDFKLDVIKRYSLITLGCVLYSLGVSLFLDAGGLASGGVTGIAIILHKVFLDNGITIISTGLIVAIINIPLLIIGLVQFGKKFLFSTVYSTLISSLLMMLWTFLFETFYHLPLTDNLLINAVCGGTIFGAGAGIIFRMGGSTGGTDIPVKILRRKFRHLSTGTIALVSDIIIVSASFIVFRSLDVLFYTIISVVIFTPVFDYVLYGGNSAKMVYIISTGERHRKYLTECLKN